MDIKRLVGRNIRAVRKAKRLSQIVLAERSDLSADFIGKVERGTTSPSVESLKAIAEALNLPMSDLFAGESRIDPSQAALMELIELCKGRGQEDIELLVGIARLLFHRPRARSQRV